MQDRVVTKSVHEIVVNEECMLSCKGLPHEGGDSGKHMHICENQYRTYFRPKYKTPRNKNLFIQALGVEPPFKKILLQFGGHCILVVCLFLLPPPSAIHFLSP